MNSLAPLLPLVGLAALVVVAIRRRREKKKRFEGQNGRT
jgi:hypothetical protein